MTGSSYQLSCSEQNALKKRLEAALRVQRLKEVRAQDRQLAKQRARAYQELCVDSAQQLQQQLVELITQQREHDLACLKAQYEEALAGLAAAQEHAAETEEQRALQAQQKQQLYLQRQSEAQARFNAALTQVRNARQSELQAVLEQVQRRQDIMLQERSKARGFAEQAKEATLRQAQQHAELNLQEEQRRRQNQVSRIDFRYSRLHDLGPPHLVVNHRDLPQLHGADGASQAQAEAARLQEEKQAQAQQQQENARRAADRGVSAQKLLQAEQNRRRMEQALQELEGNALQQQKQDLVPDKLAAAPLLRKWHKQKLQAKARSAFERDFLQAPALAGLPSFVALDDRAGGEAQQQGRQGQAGERPRSPAHQAAAAADRALKLVQQLERQRKAEASAAAVERQQQQQEAARRLAVAQSLSTEDSEVPVEDLMTCIPPVSSAGSQQLSHAAAASTGIGSESPILDIRSSMGLTELLQGDQEVSTSAVLPSTSAALDSQASPLSPVDSAAPESLVQADLQLSQPDDSSIAAALLEASRAVQPSTTPGTEASAATLAEATADEATVLSSKDSLDAIIAAADEVLRQLPAEMQAAAAARAAAAAQPAPRALATQQGPAGSSTESFQLSDAAVASQAAPGNMQQQQQEEEEEEPAPDSSADAAAILAELRSLQQQLGVQVLASESSDSALAELQSFDADINQLAAKQLRAPLPRVGSRPTPAAASQAAAGGGAAARAPTSSASASADAAAISAGLSAALASARQQLQGAAGSAAWEQQPQQPARTELDDLIDRILAPEYPSNMMSGPLAGPLPSMSSPTRPAGRAARRAAAGDAAGLRQGTATTARPLAAQLTAGAVSAARAAGRDAAAAAAAVGDSRAHSADADLVEKLKALGMDLQALGVSGMAEVTSMLNSSSGGGSGSSGFTSGSIGSASLEPTGPPEALAALRASLAGSSSTSLTLPTTILQATGATAGAGAQHPRQQATRLPPRPPQLHEGPRSSRSVAAGDDPARQRVSAVSLSTSAPSLSGLLQRALVSLAAAAAAGHPAAASAAAAGLLSSVSATSDSSCSLSASQEASLMTLEQLLRTEAPAAPTSSSGGSSGLAKAAAAEAQGPADVAATAPSSIVSLPSTLLRTAGGVAGSTLTQASQAGSSSAAPPAAPAAVGGHSAVQQAAAMQQQEDPYALLRDLLSLSGSSSPGTPRSPRQHAAATAAPQRQVGVPSGPLASSFSSAISSMSDSELEQLLQKAVAAATQGSGAPVSAPLAEAAAAAVSSGAAGAVQSGNVGSIEAALEAMLAAAGATNAAAAGSGSVGFDQASASTTFPSTIMRGMQPPTRQQQVQVQGGPAAAAAGAVGGVEAAAAASALQRAKRSSRARAAEAASGSHSSGSADSGSSGSSGDCEPSSGDLSSGSSNSLSIQQARGPGQHYEHHADVSSSYQPAGASSSIAGYAASGSGSSTLSLPSTIHNVTTAVSQPGATAPATAAAAARAGQPDVQQQQHQQRSHVAEQCWDRDGAPLDPIHEEDEASSSSASGLLSASTQEIDALLARLAQEHMQPHQQLAAAAGVGAGTSSDSGASGTISGTSSTGLGSVGDVFAAEAAGGAAGASSSSRQDGVMSSDSFSEVVSSLMLHIDTTIGALAAGSSGSSAQAAPGAAAAAAGQHGAPSAAPAAVHSPQQIGPVSYLLQDEVPGFSFGAGSSSAGSYNTPAGIAPAAALRATAVGSAAAASGGASSSSAAPGSVGISSSSVNLSGINSDTPTDSSTQRYVQQVLMGIMSSSSAATGTTASPDWDTGSSRRQPDPSNRPTGAPVASAAAARHPLAAALPGQAAAAGDQAGSSRQRMQDDGSAGSSGPFVFDTPRQLSGQPAREAAGGLLSPESTAESSLGSSGDTEQLLVGLSSGSLVIGPSSSSSSSAGSAVQQPAAAGQGTTRAHGRHHEPPMQPAGPQLHLSAAAALEQGEVHMHPSGTPATSITAISSALRVAAETRGVGGPSSGGFLSPDGSSASESSSSKRLQTATTGAAAAAGAASSSAAADGTVPLHGHLPRPVAGIPLPSAQQQRDRAGPSEAQSGSSVHYSGGEQQPLLPSPLQQQQQQLPPVASVGLGALLAEIIADDAELLQQQPHFDRQQQ